MVWTYPELSLEFHKGKCWHLAGDVLEQGGSVLLARGDPAPLVMRLLGRPSFDREMATADGTWWSYSRWGLVVQFNEGDVISRLILRATSY